ncbi:unnamed protein product [Schistosoma curassoni]|uniref:Uncharacterized protein n=1 Tax=Schistosoma curassoni TaxID=6186 RepID=A0A183K004_9TREM|nr:unnamed protein product [Schistosoma curassoni]
MFTISQYLLHTFSHVHVFFPSLWTYLLQLNFLIHHVFWYRGCEDY